MYRRSGQEPSSFYSPNQIRRVLEGAGITVESEVDSDYIVFCPYHNNYRTPAGEISKDTGRFFCFSCHENHPLIELVMHVSGKTYFEAQRLIESNKADVDVEGSIDKILSKSDEIEPFDELMIKRLHNQALASPRAMDYYAYRKISENSIKKFQLGYSDNRDMVVTPVHSPDGSVYYGFVGRSIEGKQFKNTVGNWRSQTLFNLHRAKLHGTVYLVESNFDAIRLDQCGVPAVATLGAYVSNKQISLLTRHFNSVIVVADNDDGGNNMIDKAVKDLGNRVTVVGIPSRFKDVGDMSDDDINIMVEKINDPLFAISI